MQKLTRLQRRMAILMYVIKKGEATSLDVLNDYIVDVNHTTVNIILRELTENKYLIYRVDNGCGRRVYRIHPDLFLSLKEMIVSIDENQQFEDVA